jgi:hypothetical protein
MERGLLWLPLLIMFFWLAWSGWNEYQKVENYRIWAKQFEQSKYDIYAIIGKKRDEITWGKPTRKGIINLQKFSLKNTENLRLLIDDQPIDLEKLPSKGKPSLEFILDNKESIKIPFTEIDLALKWYNFLKQFVVARKVLNPSPFPPM